MGDANILTEFNVLDHSYFSKPSTAALSPCLAHWEAVSAKHPHDQMLALRGCNPLKGFISSVLGAEEEQLLGTDLVKQQHADVEVKSSTSKVQPRIQNLMGSGRSGWTENEAGFTSDDISVALKNGVFRVMYSSKLFYIYIFHFTYAHSDLEFTILTWNDASNVLGKRLIAEAYTWSSTLREQMWVYHGALGGWRKDSSFYKAVITAQEDDIVLPNDIIMQLYRDTLTFFSSSKLYKDLQVTWKRGILLLGPPGNGKTNMIRILLQKCKGIPALYVQSANTDRGAEMGMHAIFAKARQSAPCILILEDVETLVSGDARSFMLNQLDGIESNDGILVIATANDISKLDAAILQRPSRFDAKYMFNLPDEELRSKFIVKWFENKVKMENLVYDSKEITNLDQLLSFVVESTHGWSFAFLKELFISYLLTIAATASKEPAIRPLASVQAFIDNIKLLSTSQMTLSTTRDA